MKFSVQHDPIRQLTNVYCELAADPNRPGTRTFLTRRNDEQYIAPMVYHVALGGEPPIWDWFPDEVITALGEALAPRPVATERHLDDALSIRDRLLAMVEANQMSDMSGDNGPQHIMSEASVRRSKR